MYYLTATIFPSFLSVYYHWPLSQPPHSCYSHHHQCHSLNLKISSYGFIWSFCCFLFVELTFIVISYLLQVDAVLNMVAPLVSDQEDQPSEQVSLLLLSDFLHIKALSHKYLHSKSTYLLLTYQTIIPIWVVFQF